MNATQKTLLSNWEKQEKARQQRTGKISKFYKADRDAYIDYIMKKSPSELEEMLGRSNDMAIVMTPQERKAFCQLDGLPKFK